MPVEPNPYDDEKLAEIRAGQEDPYVQYFIVRKDLEMGPGKIAAQVAHGAVMFAFRYKDLQREWSCPPDFSRVRKIEVTNRWARESFRKRVKKASKKEFEKIREEFDCFLVRDAGLTEVESGSETVLALWPMLDSKTPGIIRKLRLL
jgi:PTH2 family peptidyl-tRNA hydrolase